jgi:transposase InsO family protein
METHALEQRLQFVRAAERGHWSMSELCARFGVSRPTGYKWLARYRANGEAGLRDHSRAPHTCPHQMEAAVAAQLLAARRRYRWGARKLLRVLQTQEPDRCWPARSTVNDLFARHGLLRRRRHRSRWLHPGAPPLRTTRPNEVWPIDFKGQFKTGDGRYCYPLTVTDHFSRLLVVCHGLASVQTAATRAVLTAAFRAVGLPEAIRTDNGVPFVTAGPLELSALAVWWMQLGITHQRIAPGRPQHNGTHERMHRELKWETTRPAAATARAQQRRFDAFRRRYNEERPHEALGDATPVSRWCPSPRPFPERHRPPDYPAALECRRVSTTGTFAWRGRAIFLSQTLHGEDIALEEVDEGRWNLIYYRTVLGRLDTRTGQVTRV